MLYLFDLDGTLVSSYMDLPDRDYHAWQVLPGRRERLAALRGEGHELGIVTNQAGVALGFVGEPDFWRKVREVRRALDDGAPEMVEVSFGHPRARAPRGTGGRPEWDLRRRKPSGRMIRDAIAKRPDAAAEGVLYVGDRHEDRQAARDAGVAFADADGFFRAGAGSPSPPGDR